MKAGKLSLETLWSQLLDIDFLKTAPRLEVPVYFFAGRHDYQTPFLLVEQYFDMLECPYKELIWFENSAHLLNYEEPMKFHEECIKVKEKMA
ncbi:alpha/beta fold hydrolase [Neobacillus ginsengisoli]|uniref:Pimeloyl-ACP methyl ester carboxylesterase n=1 Tax=Neobacillus ginsengisoli TaxID=904295 RepID=A0ABT9XYF6_9BACI|nr:alpha/beta hydrolase [Neobacillus ginsengisoli]MDQ0200428.1 pimeloyl-ACP methyl ester carboxylesterase [Neobacillus ginsengisoli]